MSCIFMSSNFSPKISCPSFSVPQWRYQANTIELSVRGDALCQITATIFVTLSTDRRKHKASLCFLAPTQLVPTQAALRYCHVDVATWQTRSAMIDGIIIDTTRRVYVMDTVSVCLSVCPILRRSRGVRRVCCCGSRGQAISIHSSTAVSSNASSEMFTAT